MNFAQAYEFDESVQEGVWRTLTSGLRVKVASIRNPRYTTALKRLNREYAADIQVNNEEVINMIASKAMAEAILLDWEGATDLDGNPLPYSRQVAEEMLMKYEKFREEVSQVAVRDENYLAGAIVEKSDAP